MNFTKDTLWDLRQEIRLGSLFYNDYRNSFGVDEHDCCDFFDGFIEWYEYERNHEEDSPYYQSDDDWFYDNPEDLWDYYSCTFEYEPLPIQQDDDYYDESKNRSKKKVKESILTNYDSIDDFDYLDNGYMDIEDLIRFGFEGALDYLRNQYEYDVHDMTTMSATREDVSDDDLIAQYGDIVFVPEDFGEEFWIDLK